MFAENYSGYFSEMAHEAGLLYYNEPYGDCPSDDIQYGGYADVPMGEFWSTKGHSLDVSNTKLASSIGHIYGRRFIGAEAFTSQPEASMWTKGPFEHKAQGDAVYCNGINRLIYQRYAHQPWTNPVRYPGMTMGQFGTNFDRTLTWWKQGKDWLSYQARCQYMLQEGRFFADVLYFSGEGAPNDGGAATVYYPDKAEDLRNSTKLPLGYDYDACDTHTLSLLKVVDGNLTLPSGMTYRLLVLPDEGAFTPETLKEILRLVEAGATIVGGEKPQQSPSLRGYPACDESVRKLSGRIWSKIISGQRLEDVLASLKLQPDFQAPERSGLGYIHRLLSGMDVYFVACPSLSGDDADCTFRISGMKPEFWNPETGVISDVPLYTESNGLTTIPIHFDPAGSVFVVFRKYTKNEHITSIKQTSTGMPQNKKPVTDLKIFDAKYGNFADEIEKYNNVTSRIINQLTKDNRTIKVSNDNLGGDPAHGERKIFCIDYQLNGSVIRKFANENSELALPKGAKVVRALYGVITDEIEHKPQVVDIKDKLQSLIREGTISVIIDNDLTGGKDIAPKQPKEARISYSIDGVRSFITVPEKRVFKLPEFVIPVPAYELKTSVAGETELFVWKPSSFKITTSSGKTLNINKGNVPEPVEITGPWKLSFPPGWGAPGEVTLDKLISWTKHPDNGVKYFSGTATYEKTFVWNSKPDISSRLILDLGYLKNFAEIEVNGKRFPVLWKPPYRVDITDIVKAGDNTLKVKITNYWPNRLIGDEQLPADCEWEVMPSREGMRLKNWPQWILEDKPSPTGRYTFTTWLYWRKYSQPLPSGLFGPVLLREIKEVKVF